MLGLVDAILQQFGGRNIIALRILALAQRQIAFGKKTAQFSQQCQLVLDRQFDIDTLDAVGVFPHPVQRNHHVFIDLESVGMFGNGGGAGTIEPELLARFRRNRNEALADMLIGHADNFGCGLRDCVLIISDDVAEQGHFRQHATLGLGRITDCAQVALVQMLQTSQNGAPLQRLGIEVILDFDNRWNRVARLPEKLQAYGTRVLGHFVQNPARRCDQTVAALFLNARQPCQKLVGDVLAQAFLAEGAAGDFQRLGPERRIGFSLLARMCPFEFEFGDRDIVNLAEVMLDTCDFQPVAVRIDHAPAGEVVQRGAPQHGLLAARVHRDIAADARRFGRSRINREHEAGFFRRIRHALGYDTGTGMDRRVFAVDARQHRHFDCAQLFQFFRIDHGRQRRQWNRATGVTGTAAARNNRQSELDTALHQAGHFIFGVGRQHHERIFNAPVSRVGHVRHARQAVELDVVFRRIAAEQLVGTLAQSVGLAEFFAKIGHCLLCGAQQCFHIGATTHRLCIACFRRIGSDAAFIDFAQTMVQRIDQILAALRIVEHVVLQVRITPHHPDVAQHFIQHARGTSGLARAAQVVQQAPCIFAQQADHDFTVGKRGVVVRNLAQARGNSATRGVGEQSLDLCGGVHRMESDTLILKTERFGTLGSA